METELSWLKEELVLLEKINVHYMQEKCYDIFDEHKQQMKLRISKLEGEK
jgi:hypothetical protein